MFPRYFATGNLGKLKHVNHILGVELEHLDIDLLEVQSMDLTEIIKIKAEDAFRKAGNKPVLVEDTSFEIEALHRLPGPFIKWFLETLGNEGILKLLAGENNRKAVVKSAFAFFDGEKHYIGLGEMHGKITDKVRAVSFFGTLSWNPLFIPNGFEKTLAETPDEHLSEAFKKIDMRVIALDELKKKLAK